MDPSTWPEITQDELDGYLGPGPESKYGRDRAWIQKRFLDLHLWDCVKRKNAKRRWCEVEGQLWFLDPQLEGEGLIQEVLERKAFWLQETRQAWEDLDTGEEFPTKRNRGETIFLLHEVFYMETVPEMTYSPQYWRWIREERNTRYRNLGDSHREVEKAVQRANDTLEKYMFDVWQASRKPLSPIGASFSAMTAPPGTGDKESMAIEEALAGLLDGLAQAGRKINEAKTALSRCKNAVSTQQQRQHGRRERSALNSAILELDKKYHKLSAHQALQRIHTLLYVAGLWSNPEYQSLTAKFYQIRKQSSH
jgi:hypothetical protein